MQNATQVIYQKMSKKDKDNFDRGIGPIIASRRVINARSLHSGDMTYQLLILGLLFIIFSPAIMCKNFDVTKLGIEGILSMIIKGVFLALSYVYFISAFLWYALDLDSAECYFFGFNKSVYSKATGVTKRDLKTNDLVRKRGLIGEYKGYVLSRSLKVPHKVLFNVCVPMENGNFQEVDCIIITRNIIYVLECKNRGGVIQGNVNDKKWMQKIGSQSHESENIYIQNQKHTMAIDKFLLKKGIIKNGQNVCMNVLFSAGDMKLYIDKMPLDFVFGNMKQIKKFIEKHDETFDDGTDTTGVMMQVYDALLPYALYTEHERAAMMNQRDMRKKEFALGEFMQKSISHGIQGVSEVGQSAIIRYNRLYTQLLIENGGYVCWQTRTDIPSGYTNNNNGYYNRNQISVGVSAQRVEQFKAMTAKKERPLLLKKIVIPSLLISLAIIITLNTIIN